MKSVLENYVIAHWNQLPDPGPVPGRISLLGQATGVSKVCIFIFVDGETSPRYVVKVPRSPAYNEELMHEVTAVQDLREKVSQTLRATLPGPLHVAQVSDHWIVVEPVIPGRPMESLIKSDRPLDRGQIARLMDLAFEWLVSIQLEAMRFREPLDAYQIRQHFLDPMMAARTVSQLSVEEQNYLDRQSFVARELEGHRLPLNLYHGDFAPGNILLDGSRIAVLDWQFSRRFAPPLLDWFRFVFRVYGRAAGLPDIDGSLDEYRSAFDQVFFARNWYSGLVSDYTRTYCRIMGIDLEHISLLFCMFLVSSIVKYQAFLSKRAGRGYLYLLEGIPASDQSFRQRLRRQAYVWLLGELAARPSVPLAALVA